MFQYALRRSMIQNARYIICISKHASNMHLTSFNFSFYIRLQLSASVFSFSFYLQFPGSASSFNFQLQLPASASASSFGFKLRHSNSALSCSFILWLSKLKYAEQMLQFVAASESLRRPCFKCKNIEKHIEN